jgi:hypothetical protein
VPATGAAPGPDALQAAWPSVVEGLKGATRGMFRDGRFDVGADGGPVLVVPKGPPADQLEKRRPEVEAALAAHLGVAVPLQIVVDAEAEPAPAAPEPSAPASAEDEVIDVHALDDAPPAGSGVDRLAEAFPGAELVEE